MSNFDTFGCFEDLQIYKFDVFNLKNGREDYILYGSKYISDSYKEAKELYKEQGGASGCYLHIFPGQCIYSRDMPFNASTEPSLPEKHSCLTGIFKYSGDYYFYVVHIVEFRGEATRSVETYKLIGGYENVEQDLFLISDE